MSLSIPFPFFGWLLNKKAARVEVNISLAFLHWVWITFHPWPFVSDIAIFVLKRDVKLQLTGILIRCAVRLWTNCNSAAVFVVRCNGSFISVINHGQLHYGRLADGSRKPVVNIYCFGTENRWNHTAREVNVTAQAFDSDRHIKVGMCRDR